MLRYWLQAVRHAEALATRPKARRPAAVVPPIDLRDPQEGAAYARLDASTAAGFLTRAEREVDVPMDPGVQGFFERWLTLKYRSEIAAIQGWAEAATPAWIVGFPVLHFAQRDELATLVRFETQVRWKAEDGKNWQSPTYKQRRANELPPPPMAMHLHAPTAPEDEAPFSLDPTLLGRTLGLNEEEIGALLATLRTTPAPSPEAVLRALCLALEAGEGFGAAGAPADEAATPSPQDWLERLHRAVAARLPEGVRVWPFGLVYDGSPLFATYHLQRELAELLRRPLGVGPWGPGSGFWAWLSGGPSAKEGWQALAAVRDPRGVTADQRAVAERFLGSNLTAAQGPPGTGKTELILNLAAHAVAERGLGLALNPGGEVGDTILMVCSTNNRAVDNVIDPLGVELHSDRLPIALRTGSQPVVAGPTADTLGRVLAWLDAQDPTDADKHLAAALSRLRAAADAHEARVRPQHQYEADRALLAALEARMAAAPPPAVVPRIAPEVRKLATRGARQLVRHLETVRAILSQPVETDPLTRARGRLAAVRLELLPALLASLAGTGLDTEPELMRLAEGAALRLAMPELEEALEEGQDAAEALLDLLLAEKSANREAQRRIELSEQIADLRAKVSVAPPPADAREISLLACAVYERALIVRERWAVARQLQIRQAVTRALAFALEERSLRKLFARAPDVETWLRRLFPVWGCTLLSLGNVLPAEADVIDRLVIDEAGQCHPAYAVSGILRARQTLCIGDVHQLEPVIDLTPSDENRLRWRCAAEVSDTRLAPYRLVEGLGGAKVGGFNADDGGASAQSLADRAVPERLALHDHFRCQPEIIALSDRLCRYHLRVHTPPRSLGRQVPLLHAPVLFGEVRGAQQRARGSWQNDAEIEAVLSLLRTFERGGIDLQEVAVITPYTGQLEVLNQRLRAVGRSADQGGPALGTVHRFQGGERRVVIFSTVITRPASLPFIDRRVNLLNVAISRAMDHLVVLGDSATLREGRHTRLLVEASTPL